MPADHRGLVHRQVVATATVRNRQGTAMMATDSVSAHMLEPAQDTPAHWGVATMRHLEGITWRC
jgi:hypothetical protein